MKLREKISLETLDDKQFKVRIVEQEDYNEAVLTHYLHNSQNGVSEFFKKDAIKFIKK